jgi:hypothetical protein
VKYKAIKARRAKWAIYSLLGIIPVWKLPKTGIKTS